MSRTRFLNWLETIRNYFPRFFHPDPTVKRQSGFLAPFFTNSSTLGTGSGIPYYWAIGNNKDLTFTPKMYAKENVLFLKRSDIYIANIIKCRPPQSRDPEIEEIDACKGYLLKQIEIIKPKIIVTLGRIAFRYLLNDTTPITKARGKMYDFNGIKVIPTYHPSYLLRNPSKKKEAMVDLKFIQNSCR